MEYNIIITAAAREDLDEILAYMTVSLKNPSAAAAFASEVTSCYNNLKNLPFMYRKCSRPHLRAQGYRKAVIGNYIMVYRVCEAEETVYISRFFYGRRNHYEDLI